MTTTSSNNEPKCVMPSGHLWSVPNMSGYSQCLWCYRRRKLEEYVTIEVPKYDEKPSK